jgi:hypothetical protein
MFLKFAVAVSDRYHGHILPPSWRTLYTSWRSNDVTIAYRKPCAAASEALHRHPRADGGLRGSLSYEGRLCFHIHDLIALASGATRGAAESPSVGALGQGGRGRSGIATRRDQPDLSVATIATRHRVNPGVSSAFSKATAPPSQSMCLRSALSARTGC